MYYLLKKGIFCVLQEYYFDVCVVCVYQGPTGLKVFRSKLSKVSKGGIGPKGLRGLLVQRVYGGL